MQDMSKLDRLPSKKLADFIRKNPDIIEDIDYEGGFNTPNGLAYDVLLAKGWGYNHYGDHMHTIIEPRANDVIAFLRTAVKCDAIGCDE